MAVERVGRHGGAAAEFLAAADDVETVGLLPVGRRGVVAAVGQRAVDRQILVRVVGVVARDQVVPVGAGAVIVAAACQAPLIGREHLGLVAGESQRAVRVKCDNGQPWFACTLFGGDQDHAVRTARTVDGGRRSVLQHRHRLDVLRGKRADIAAGHAVDHDQRTVAGAERRSAAHLQVGARVRVGRRRARHVEAGDFACKHFHRAVHGAALKVVAVDLHDRARQLLAAQRPVAHDHDFVEQLIVLGHGHIDFRAAADRLLDCLEADVAEYQSAAGRHGFECVVAVEVGRHGVLLFALDRDADADQHLARRVGDRTRHSQCLSRHRRHSHQSHSPQPCQGYRSVIP